MASTACRTGERWKEVEFLRIPGVGLAYAGGELGGLKLGTLRPLELGAVEGWG